MPFWNSLLKKRAEDWLYYHFTNKQVPDGAEPKIIPANQAYANIWLKSARVVNVRSGLKRFYGVVHSYINVMPVAQAEKVEVNTVVAPKLLQNVDPRSLDRVVPVNHRLLGPVAHSGNDVEMEVGLFSIAEADLVAPYLGMLERISEIGGVGFLKGALPLAVPIREGINAILSGEGDNILEIGLCRVFQPLKTGFHLVMRVPQDQADPSTFKLDGENWRVLGADGKPVKDFPYLVFEIASTKEKHDFAKIPELKRQYDLVNDAIIRGDAKEADAAWFVFRRLARTSSDLIKEDADRLTELVRKEVDDSLGVSQPQAAFAPRKVREFVQLKLYARP